MRSLLTSLVALGLASSAYAGDFTPFVIVDLNEPGTGISDPTVVAPIGGNPGATLGEQRLISLSRALEIWAESLDITQTITVGVTFTPQFCDTGSAVLASAGTASVFQSDEFPLTGTWYHGALAQELAGMDLDPDNVDIVVFANSELDEGNGCLADVGFYYGLDHMNGGGIDFLSTMTHELGHGLGFANFTDETSGTEFSNVPDVFSYYTNDQETELTWWEMTDEERIDSAINGPNVTWKSEELNREAKEFLHPAGEAIFTEMGSTIARSEIVDLNFTPPALGSGVMGELVAVIDEDGGTIGCATPFQNEDDLVGRVALVERGCNFVESVGALQDTGAIGVIIYTDDRAIPFFTNDPQPGWDIPAVMISREVGLSLVDALTSNTLSVSFQTSGEGRTGMINGEIRLNAPNPVQPGSSISHFDPIASPNILMEPSINPDLGDSLDLTPFQMRDIGWTLRGEGILVNSTVVDENAGNAMVEVRLSQAFDSPVSVDFATRDAFAVDGIDYETTSGTLDFGIGELSKSFPVTIIDNDVEAALRSFVVHLSNPIGAPLLRSTAGVLILDNEDFPDVSVPEILEVDETDSNTEYTLTVSLDRATTQPLMIDYEAFDISGVEGIDYEIDASPLTIATGEETGTIAFTIIGDDIENSDRDLFEIEIKPGDNYFVQTNTTVIRVIEDDIDLDIQRDLVGVNGVFGDNFLLVDSCSDVTIELYSGVGLDLPSPEVTVTSNSSGVSIQNETLIYPTIPAYTYPDLPTFTVCLDDSIPCGFPISLNVLVSSGDSVASFDILFLTGEERESSYFDSTAPALIGDESPNIVTSEIEVSGLEPGAVSDLLVSMVIEHTYLEDLIISLISPSGVRMELIAYPKNGPFGTDCPPDGNDVLFSDSGLPYDELPTGVFTPWEFSFAEMLDRSGAELNGTWTLEIEDTYDGDGGELSCWTLAFDSVSCTNQANDRDIDRDGLNNSDEIARGTDPFKADTDMDGVDDGVEVAIGTDPLDPDDPADSTDSDGDGIPDAFDANPDNPDADGDGFLDGFELSHHSDPNDADSVPTFGDIDGNGMLDNVDAVLLIQYFLEFEGTMNPIPGLSDMNRDGVVDNIDAILLFNWLVGNIPYLPFQRP